jgi:hypothetical protein
MTKVTPHVIVGMVVACCWLPLIFALFPIPEDELHLEVWIPTLLLFSLGLGSAVLVFLNSKYWRISVVGTSLLYLAAYFYDLSSLPATSIVGAVILDWELAAKLRNVNSTGLYIFTLLKNFILPAMHLMLVVGVTFLLLAHKNNHLERKI